jgi:hypothetical protein
MYVFGITHELAKKVNFGRMSVFMIRIFPIIVRLGIMKKGVEYG